MAKKTRGVFQIILNSIFSSSGPKIKPRLMGEDYYGTKYFEEPPQSSGRKTRGRFFEPIDKDNFEQELPAEWEAWLRYRRAEPPTKEEIEINYQIILTKRKNAAKLELEYAAKRDPALAVKDKPTSGSFPVYAEYKSFGKK